MAALVEVSKLNVYVVVDTTSAELSKLNTYAVLDTTSAELSKLNTYLVLDSEDAFVSKLNVYVVLDPFAPPVSAHKSVGLLFHRQFQEEAGWRAMQRRASPAPPAEVVPVVPLRRRASAVEELIWHPLPRRRATTTAVPVARRARKWLIIVT